MRIIVKDIYAINRTIWPMRRYFALVYKLSVLLPAISKLFTKSPHCARIIRRKQKDSNMPVTKSAIKAMKQNRKANERNKATKADFRGKVKVVKKAVAAGEKDLGKITAEAISAIDKAAKKGVIHQNTAARRKSRLVIALNKSLGKALELVSSKQAPKTKAAPKAKTATKKPATKTAKK